MLLTIEETANFLSLSSSRVYSLIEEGKLRKQKLGGSIRVPFGEAKRIRDERCMHEQMLSTETVSARLRVSEATVRRMCRETVRRRKFYFRCRQTEKGWRIDKDSFDDFLKRSTDA